MRTSFLFTVCLVVSEGVVHSASLPPDVMTARFKDDCPAAVSLTFDDALESQLETAIPTLDRYGLKGTFFLLCSNVHPEGVSTWEAWRKAVANGHEAGSHSLTHPMLTQVRDPQRVRDEIKGSADMIADRLGARPTAFAYPSSDINSAVKHEVLKEYLFDRAYCRVWGGDGFTTADGIRHLEQAVEQKDWFYCMLHGVGEKTWGSITPEMFEVLAAYLDSHRALLWTDTYSRVSSYVRKRNAASVSLRDIKEDGFAFRLTLPKNADLTGLPPIPLTVKVALDGHDGSRVRAEVDGVRHKTALSACGLYVLTEIEPDGTWVHILWN